MNFYFSIDFDTISTFGHQVFSSDFSFHYLFHKRDASQKVMLRPILPHNEHFFSSFVKKNGHKFLLQIYEVEQSGGKQKERQRMKEIEWNGRND